jgi:iron(III) transport system substrate-binding protein
MRYATVSRRDAIKLSAALGSALVVPGVLRAEAPKPSAITADMIEAAGKEGLVVFYTAMDIPLAEELAKAFERRYPGVKVRVKRSGAIGLSHENTGAYIPSGSSASAGKCCATSCGT